MNEKVTKVRLAVAKITLQTYLVKPVKNENTQTISFNKQYCIVTKKINCKIK